MELRLDYSLKVSPTAVSPMRMAIEQLLAVTGADDDLLHRVTMTVHELLENVAKYSQDGHGRLMMEIVEGRMVITVENSASPQHLDRIREWMSALEVPSDSLQHCYRSLLLRSTTWSGSGLGLARIRAEGCMDLTAAIHGDRITLRASADE